MKRIILGLLLTTSLISYSQNGEKNFIDQNYIEVTGTAEMEIIPDLIYINIILSEKDFKDDKNLENIEKTMIDKLNEIAIDVKKSLSVKDLESNFKINWISKTDIILTKEYQLVINDAKTLQKVFSELQKIGISMVTITKLDHSKIDDFKKETKLNAIRTAKDKAQLLTSTINQTIGRAIYIQEIGNFIPYQGTPGYGANMKIRGVGSINSTDDNEVYDLAVKKIKLEYSILVRFELK